MQHHAALAGCSFLTFFPSALKLSILCLYLRMTPDKSHKRIVYTMMGLVTAHNIAALFVSTSSPLYAPQDPPPEAKFIKPFLPVCGISLQTSFRILEHPLACAQQPALRQHPCSGPVQRLVERFRGCHHLAPPYPGGVETQGSLRSKR